MAHLPPNAAIFSPSVARAAASTAKDWNFVDSWLSTKYHGRTPPAFERNSETLRALLTLAAANEAADEGRDLVARVGAVALQELEAYRGQRRDPEPKGSESSVTATDEQLLRNGILDSLESALPREAKSALESMAAAAVELGIAFPEPDALAQKMQTLQTHLFSLEQAHGRVTVLQRHIDAETRSAGELLRHLHGDQYRPPSDLAKQNLEAQRTVKAISIKLPDLRDRVTALASSIGMPAPAMEQIRDEEHAYLDLLAEKKELDTQVKTFQGLPPDTEYARRQLEGLRAELRSITQHRDAVFEGLVERETPKKQAR